MRKKIMWSLSLVALLSFNSCGDGNSEEAKELLQKILKFVGIPQEIIVNVCQDSNGDGICGVGELSTKLTINKGDTIDDIWHKISLTDDGKYFIQTYQPELPLVIELQDAKRVKYDNGKFTLSFNGFKTKKDDNETKEISLLESMVDKGGLDKAIADKFRTLNNSEAQNKFYTHLLNDSENNLNTFREQGLDSKKAIDAVTKDISKKVEANQEEADNINACGNNQDCIDSVLERFSNILIDDNETSEQNSTTDDSNSSDNTFKSTLKKSGQTTSYQEFDDAYYQIGITPSYSRSGEVVIDNIRRLEWQDNEDAKTIRKNWNDAKSYCSSLSLDNKSGWRLPTRKELKSIVDYGKANPAISSVFVNVADDTSTDCQNRCGGDSPSQKYSKDCSGNEYYSNDYWTSDFVTSDTSNSWFVNFYHGFDNFHGQANENFIRCVRGE